MNDIISNVLKTSLEGHEMLGITNTQHHEAMRYVGGKFHIRKEIGEYLNKIRKDKQSYYEPFVGSAWILAEIKDGPNYASDVNEYLIALWKALQKGWIPPSKITQTQYDKAKKQVMENDGKGKMSKELLAFIGFGCSFYGMWFSTYAKDGDANFALRAKTSLLEKVKNIHKDTKFKSISYEDLKPEKNSLIYCDPPYKDTAQAYSKTDFDSEKFWDWVRKMSKAGHTVLVSEYKAPSDFKAIKRIETKSSIVKNEDGKKGAKRIEKLYQLK